LVINEIIFCSLINEITCPPLPTRAKMESDREQADLGPTIPEDINGDTVPEPRQPKKRFIGRRAAAERAAGKGQTDGGIEDSNAVQGAAIVYSSQSYSRTDLFLIQSPLPGVQVVP
jgi:hypothetical protein